MVGMLNPVILTIIAFSEVLICALVIGPRYVKDTINNVLYPLSPCTNFLTRAGSAVHIIIGRWEDRVKNGGWQGPRLFFCFVIFCLPGNGFCPSTR